MFEKDASRNARQSEFEYEEMEIMRCIEWRNVEVFIIVRWI